MDIQTRIGRSFWFDIPAADPVDAMAFYEGLFGWTFLRLKDDAVKDYWVIQKDRDLIGGLRQTTGDNAAKTAAETPVLYFTVAELSPAVARARELGAKIVGQRVDMGEERGSTQHLRDRQNNLIALWAPK